MPTLQGQITPPSDTSEPWEAKIWHPDRGHTPPHDCDRIVHENRSHIEAWLKNHGVQLTLFQGALWPTNQLSQESVSVFNHCDTHHRVVDVFRINTAYSAPSLYDGRENIADGPQWREMLRAAIEAEAAPDQLGFKHPRIYSDDPDMACPCGHAHDIWCDDHDQPRSLCWEQERDCVVEITWEFEAWVADGSMNERVRQWDCQIDPMLLDEYVTEWIDDYNEDAELASTINGQPIEFADLENRDDLGDSDQKSWIASWYLYDHMGDRILDECQIMILARRTHTEVLR